MKNQSEPADNPFALHAPLPPSDAYRWMACPGSIELRARLTPKDSGHAARRGTLMHAYAERYLKDEGYDDLDAIDYDEQEIVSVYVAYVKERIKQMPKDAAWGTENRVSLAHLHPHVWGTCDAFFWAVYTEGDRAVVEVIDFKSGFVPVSAASNPQLIIYALGILGPMKDWVPDKTTVTVTIVQPKLATVIDQDKMDGMAMLQWAQVIAERADQTAAQHVRMPGNHCKYCAAAFMCPEYQTIRSQPMRGVVDLAGELGRPEAIAANAADIRAGVKACVDSVADGTEFLDVPVIREWRWTRGGKTALLNRYGSKAQPGGRVLSPRQAQRVLGIGDETLKEWTYTQERRKPPIAKVR